MRRVVIGLAFVVVACGSSSGGGAGDAGSGPANDAGSSGADARADGAPNVDVDGGSDADAGGDGGSRCTCDPATQYCLHGDTTSSGQHDVERCEPRVGECNDCSCYSQIGLCFEQATPKTCTVTGGVIVVECAEIP